MRRLRDEVKETKKTFDKTEDDLKALQSMGQIIGEVLRQLDDEKCAIAPAVQTPRTRAFVGASLLRFFPPSVPSPPTHAPSSSRSFFFRSSQSSSKPRAVLGMSSAFGRSWIRRSS